MEERRKRGVIYSVGRKERFQVNETESLQVNRKRTIPEGIQKMRHQAILKTSTPGFISLPEDCSFVISSFYLSDVFIVSSTSGNYPTVPVTIPPRYSYRPAYPTSSYNNCLLTAMSIVCSTRCSHSMAQEGGIARGPRLDVESVDYTT